MDPIPLVEIREGAEKCSVCNERLTDHALDEHTPSIYVLCDGTRVQIRRYGLGKRKAHRPVRESGESLTFGMTEPEARSKRCA